MWRSAALMLCLGLAACQMALPFGGGDKAPAASASDVAKPGIITGGPVTAVQLTPKPAAPAVAKPAPVPQGGVAIPSGTIKGTPPPTVAKPADPPKTETKPGAAPAEVPPQAPPGPPKSAMQLDCEAGGGLWSDAGKKGVKACVQATRDAGKSCKRESDCDGLCLARSRSCAPIKPLFGCNDILQADGGQVTLCID